MENQRDRWFKRQTVVLVGQTIVLVALAIITGVYASHTRDLAIQTARLAEMTEQQTELILGINRPHVEIDLVDVNYEYLLPPALFVPGVVLEPLALTVSINNDGERNALGGEIYVLGESLQREEPPPLGASLFDILSASTIRTYWYWSEVEKFSELAPGEKEEYVLRRKKVDYSYETVFPYIEVEEPDMKYASEVPFAFAVVAIYQDDFERVWLSARELKIDCTGDDCEIKAGRLRVFQVPSED